MDLETLSIEVDGIESELTVIKEALTRLKGKPVSSGKVRRFADLCGVWKGKISLSLEEIVAAKCRPKSAKS